MILLLLIAFFAGAADETFSADLYDLSGKTKLFTYEGSRTFKGDEMTYATTFKDLQGNVAAQEKIVSNKLVLVKYEADRPSAGDKGVVEVHGTGLWFTYTENNKTTTKKEPFKPNTMVSATLLPYLQENVDSVVAGKDLVFPFAVWFRQETVNFKVSFDKEDGGNLIFKMVPTNLLYRSLVDPIYFILDKSSKKIVQLKGRTMPKIHENGHVKEADVLAIYKYK